MPGNGNESKSHTRAHTHRHTHMPLSRSRTDILLQVGCSDEDHIDRKLDRDYYPLASCYLQQCKERRIDRIDTGIGGKADNRDAEQGKLQKYRLRYNRIKSLAQFSRTFYLIVPPNRMLLCRSTYVSSHVFTEK